MPTPGLTARELSAGCAERAGNVAIAAGALRGREPGGVVAWAVETFGAGLGFTTGLGFGGVVLLDLLRRRQSLVEAFFIDTGNHFDETLELLHRLEAWGEDGSGGRVRFTVLRPEVSAERVAELAGSPPWQADPDLCCRLRKIEPMERVLATRDAWLSALRRDQGGARAAVEAVRLDARGVLKIHPLAGWTAERCWEHIRANRLPYNPLHDCGYRSVGCVHCTVPVGAAEAERAGRWAGRGKTECGLHQG